MAAKLQCEICGGKLIGKPGGVFECEYCGTEYSTEWAKAKIQEIKGTVKVEGTVEVKGSVQVEGTANAQSLVKRGNLALEDGKWDDAEKYFDEALNADPENAEAYLGKLMADLKVCRCEDLKKQALPFDENGNYKKAIRFGDETLKAELKGFVDTIYNRGAEKKQRQEDIKKITAAYQKELDDYNKKAEMVNQNRSVYVEKLFASKMNEFIKEAEEINRKKISEINETLTGLTAEKKEQESRFESLGVFKIKEKRELQANIDKDMDCL